MFYLISSLIIPIVLAQTSQRMVGTALEGLLKCAPVAPFTELNYTFDNVHELPHELVCPEYAQRTCCSQQNLAKLQTIIGKFYLSHDITVGCSSILNNLYCYDCDGDVGTGLRRGICPGTCRRIYDECRSDYFTIKETMKPEIYPCQGSSLICSSLEDITSSPEEFCRMLGFEINEIQTLDQEALEALRTDKSQYKPFCFDLTPAAKLWGPALKRPATEKPAKKPKQERELPTFWSTLSQVLSPRLLVGLSILMLIPICACCYFFYSERKDTYELEEEIEEQNEKLEKMNKEKGAKKEKKIKSEKETKKEKEE